MAELLCMHRSSTTECCTLRSLPVIDQFLLFIFPSLLLLLLLFFLHPLFFILSLFLSSFFTLLLLFLLSSSSFPPSPILFSSPIHPPSSLSLPPPSPLGFFFPPFPLSSLIVASSARPPLDFLSSSFDNFLSSPSSLSPPSHFSPAVCPS